MSKAEFITKYNKLSESDKECLKRYYHDLYSGAVFVETFKIAEQRLIWIREAEEQ